MSIDYARFPQSGDILLPNGTTVGSDLGIAGPVAPVELYSAEWWLHRLLGRLITRAQDCQQFHDFYEGRQPLAFASDKFVEAYGARVRGFVANFMPLVVDAERERLIVDGFRFGNSPEGDKGVWKIWQQNQMDAESQIAHEIALSKGMAYSAVDPTANGPSVTIEDPTETIVETAPGNRRTRLAALKVFADDDGFNRAYLYLPDEIYKYRSTNRRTDSTYTSLSQARWVPDVQDDEDFPIINRLGVVPIIPLINRPRRDGTGRSEIEPVMGNQLAINFLRYAALIGSDVAALPQRWAKNLALEVDGDTGQVRSPFKTGKDTLWASRRPTPEEVASYPGDFPDVQFGQFPGASLEPFVRLIEEEVGQMASNSRTPYHYLLGSPTSIPPSGESLKSSEAPLVKKVEAQEIHFGEGWEETMRVALLAAGQKSKARTTDAETIWRDAETRNEGARTDSILKQYQAGLLPDEFALGELGYSQQQISRISELRSAPTPQRIDAAAVLVRAGYDPSQALLTVGLDPIKHLGFLPVTVQPQ